MTNNFNTLCYHCRTMRIFLTMYNILHIPWLSGESIRHWSSYYDPQIE